MNVNSRMLEVLLNKAAEKYDAPGMDLVAEFLTQNNVVVLPCAVGDKLYTLLELDDEELPIIDTLTVTEVGIHRIFCSAYVPPRDDITEEIALARIGEDTFLSRLDAEMALAKMKGAL